MLLAGDVGGTKTNLALFADELSLSTPVVEATFVSAEYSGLDAIVTDFLAQHPQPIERATFGVAGPVLDGHANVTNLGWQIDAQALQSRLKIPQVHLVNDLAAIANAIPLLKPDDLFMLNAGHAQATGTIAVIAPGTGLGEAYLTWEVGRYRAHSSEGGHSDFAPTSEWEMELLNFMRRTLGYAHVSYEAVCSGLGIPHLYAFVRNSQVAEEPGWFVRELEATDQPTPLIVNAALDCKRPCPIAVKTMELFVSILGSEAGNLALKVLATGGVYLAGGIPPRILPLLRSDRFLAAFRRKGRLSELLSNVPIYVVLNPKAGLIGAAASYT